MKPFYKILKISAIAILVFVGTLFAAPFFFKGKILTLVKDQVNRKIRGKTEFSDISLSFFRHFPRISLGLEDLQITGTGKFSGDTLIAAKEIDISLPLLSIFHTGNMEISSVRVTSPRIHALVASDGSTNWDILNEDSSAKNENETSSPFKLRLNHYSIRSGYIFYKDDESNITSQIINLNHEGSGDFSSDLFTLSTETSADGLRFEYGGIPWLPGVKTSVKADIEVDNRENKYSFKAGDIYLNELEIKTDGFFRLVNDSVYDMDIRFRAPSTDFRNILSLVPAIYQKDFAKIKTGGKTLFDGFVKGQYSSHQTPAYRVNLGIENGFFQYPDLPEKVSNITLKLKLDNPDGITDHTSIEIPNAHIEFGRDPFDFRLLFKQPESDRYLDAAVKGKLNLASISKFVKLEEGTRLEGDLEADLQAKGNLAVIMQQKPGPFAASGTAVLNNLLYVSKDFPQAIRNSRAVINFRNPDGQPDHTVIEIPSAHFEVGKDLADFTLLLKTPASDPSFEGTLKGSLDLANIKQFYSFQPGTSLAGQLKTDGTFRGRKSSIDKKHYEEIQTSGILEASGIDYRSKEYPEGLQLTKALLQFNPKNVSVQSLDGNFMGTRFSGRGSIDNLVGYALKNEPLAGRIQFDADKLDLNKWMGSSPTSDSPKSGNSEPFVVPKNLNLVLQSNIDLVHYDKVDYRQVSGSLLIKDETVYLQNVHMQALDGNIILGGSYSTRDNRRKPAISLDYDVQDLDVQKTFFAFNTVQKLMPIGKFIAGKLNSKMTMTGKLGEDMMPDLGTLTGAGNLFLIQGFLSKFQPMDKLASTLDIRELQNISIKDVKNYFEFANGRVLVKPFTVKVNDIAMEIGGMHGLDQSIDYVINMKVPRDKLGNTANQLVNTLASQASSRGVVLKINDLVNLKLHMGGTITSPTIKTDLNGAGSSLAADLSSQAKQFAEEKKKAGDSLLNAAKKEAKDTLASVKKTLIQDAGELVKKQVLGNKDSTSEEKDTRKKLEESAKGLFNNLLKKKKKDTDSVKKQ